MRKQRIIITILMFSFLLTGCVSFNVKRSEQPHLYWKEIDVVVEDIDFSRWYASGNHCVADVTVYSEEYNLEESFHYIGSDAEKLEYVQQGDIIKAELYSWKIDSTGEIVRRCINQLY